MNTIEQVNKFEDAMTIAALDPSQLAGIPGQAATLSDFGGIASLLSVGAVAGVQLTPEQLLLNAEIRRDWGALTPEEQSNFRTQRAAEVAPIEALRAQGIAEPAYDEHAAVHAYLYNRERLPRQVTVSELVAMGASQRNASNYARPLSDAMALIFIAVAGLLW